MSHKKDGDVWQHPFRLRSGNPEELRLHRYLVELARQDMAQGWIVKTLLAAMPAMARLSQGGIPEPTRPVNGRPTAGEPHYEPYEE